MASGYKSSIAFVTDRGDKTKEYYRDISSMEDDSQVYTKCEISKLSGEGAMWVIYSEKNYGRAGEGAGRSLIVFPSATVGNWSSQVSEYNLIKLST